MKNKYISLISAVIGALAVVTIIGVASGVGWACLITYPSMLLFTLFLVVYCWSAAVITPRLHHLSLYLLLIALAVGLLIKPLNFGLPIQSLGNNIASIIIILSCVWVYFIPTVVAMGRKAKRTVGIFLLNLLLGWTILGWIGALVWAASDNTKRIGDP